MNAKTNKSSRGLLDKIEMTFTQGVKYLLPWANFENSTLRN